MQMSQHRNHKCRLSIPLKNPLRLTALLFGQGFGRIDPDKVEFAAVEQLPLDLIAGLQADGGGQG